jgi:hypothetical protein
LSQAAEDGCLAVVKLPLDAHAEVNFKHPYEWSRTPLTHIAENSHVDVVKLLLDAYAGKVDPKLLRGDAVPNYLEIVKLPWDAKINKEPLVSKAQPVMPMIKRTSKLKNGNNAG